MKSLTLQLFFVWKAERPNNIIVYAVAIGKEGAVPGSQEASGIVDFEWPHGIRPDGTMLILWTRFKPLAWDITISDTFANSYIVDERSSGGWQSDSKQNSKIHWSDQDSPLRAHRSRDGWCLERPGFGIHHGDGKKMLRETQFVFQWLYISLHRWNDVAFKNTCSTEH